MENAVALAACGVPTRDAASQMSQDAELAKAKEKNLVKKKGKAKAMSTSQLMEEFNLESQWIFVYMTIEHNQLHSMLLQNCGQSFFPV
jgi:hypothetical protein